MKCPGCVIELPHRRQPSNDARKRGPARCRTDFAKQSNSFVAAAGSCQQQNASFLERWKMFGFCMPQCGFRFVEFAQAGGGLDEIEINEDGLGLNPGSAPCFAS